MKKDSNITASDSKMRAYQLDRPGSLDGLVLAERDVPSPAVGEVLVRVRASSLNVRDLMIINGEYPMPVPPGRVPLSDGAGEVVALGAGVTRFKVGDRVINSFFPNWFGGTFNAMPVQYVVDCDGWLTEFKAESAEELVAVPGYVTFEQGETWAVDRVSGTAPSRNGVVRGRLPRGAVASIGWWRSADPVRWRKSVKAIAY